MSRGKEMHKIVQQNQNLSGEHILQLCTTSVSPVLLGVVKSTFVLLHCRHYQDTSVESFLDFWMGLGVRGLNLSKLVTGQPLLFISNLKSKDVVVNTEIGYCS